MSAGEYKHGALVWQALSVLWENVNFLSVGGKRLAKEEEKAYNFKIKKPERAGIKKSQREIMNVLCTKN